MPSNRRGDIACILAAGVSARLAASWIMDLWQARTGPLLQRYGRRHGVAPPGEDPAVTFADDAADVVLGRPLPPARDRQAGLAVHYGFGAAADAAFALAARGRRPVGAATGALFGLVLHLDFDEALMPKLKLEASMAETPLSNELVALSSHTLFGVALAETLQMLAAA